MTIIPLDEAAAQLASLIERAEAGEEILLARDGQAVAQILPRRVEARPPLERRQGGQWEGKLWIAPDFDEWPDDIAEALGMKDS